MLIFKKISLLQKYAASFKHRGKTIGFVPTMGCLHEGHLSLVLRAKKECDAAGVSIFVNPLQFGPEEDFKKYPRDEKKDLKLLKNARADFVFLPSNNEMFSKDFSAHVEVHGHLTEILEGAFRPGHFKGVSTIVLKLFHAVMPDHAYFGMKDYQQLKVIEKMVDDFNMDVRIVPCETAREKDGLALSSRNVYLSPDERGKAVMIYRMLMETKRRIQNGEKNAGALKKKASEMLSRAVDKIDYVEICDAQTLAPIEKIKGKVVVLAAARFGGTRLIDNVVVHGV